MCRRGGSKGGKYPDGATDINVGSKAIQEHPTWHTLRHRFGRKATQWKKYPLGLFYCLDGANLETKKKQGQNLPLRKDKDFIDLLRGKGIPPGNKTDILQSELTTTIPDGGEVRNRHTNGRSQVLIFISMSTHDRLKQFFIHTNLLSYHRDFIAGNLSPFFQRKTNKPCRPSVSPRWRERPVLRYTR